LAHCFILIVPDYSRADFPGSDSYNTGFFTNADGSPRPRSLRSFAAIEPMFDAPFRNLVWHGRCQAYCGACR